MRIGSLEEDLLAQRQEIDVSFPLGVWKVSVAPAEVYARHLGEVDVRTVPKERGRLRPVSAAPGGFPGKRKLGVFFQENSL